MLFLDYSEPIIKNRWLDDAQINAFKSAYSTAFSMAFPDAPSIFDNKEIRNLASRHSFLITPAVHPDLPETNVKIELPHLPGCERTPLRKSPLVYSFNDSIHAQHPDYTRQFQLHRLKLNNVIPMPHLSDSVTSHIHISDDPDRPITFSFAPSFAYKRTAADFIDVCVLDQYDQENIHFWQQSYTIVPFSSSHAHAQKDIADFIPLFTPDISFHLHDLHNMLHVYGSPDFKKKHRESKYALFQHLLPLSQAK